MPERGKKEKKRGICPLNPNYAESTSKRQKQDQCMPEENKNRAFF